MGETSLIRMTSKSFPEEVTPHNDNQVRREKNCKVMLFGRRLHGEYQKTVWPEKIENSKRG